MVREVEGPFGVQVGVERQSPAGGNAVKGLVVIAADGLEANVG